MISLAALAAGAAIAAPALVAPLQVGTDKAAYKPGEAVQVQVAAPAGLPGGTLRLTATHLGRTVATRTLQVAAGSAAALSWQPPASDFRGYALALEWRDARGRVVASGESAVDVSSSWLKFPRYGYLTRFDDSIDAKGTIGQLKAFHLNGLQFYDWQWKHHVPVKGDPAHPAEQWTDIGGRPISARVVRDFIGESHRAGMAAMEYNLIYGALDNFERDGVDRRWALYDAPGGQIWNLPMPPDWDTKAIYLFNPADTGWQKYLFARQADVFRAFDFDGWHADTIGDHGIKYDADGKPVDIKDTFKPFLTAAKAAMGSKLLIMNTVGNKGHLGVHTSPVDAIYSEIWEDDGIVTYQQVHDMVNEARAESGGKSIIVPAYVNFDYAETRTDGAPGEFNAPGVLLTEAVVMAAGGSRLELGDDTRMLSHPYFPNRHLVMNEALKRSMGRYMDFQVAYENLLRDGQVELNRRIAIEGVPVADQATLDSVWAFAKQDPRHDIVHLINLMGVKDLTWRDTLGQQKKPRELESLRLKYYTADAVKRAYVASPDAPSLRGAALPLTRGRDARGSFVQVTVPRLDYWNMLVFERR